MVIYGLKNCDTCRKALKQLGDASFRDVRTDGVPADLKARALGKFGDKLLNRRSTTWRELGEKERTLAPEVLLAMHPTLMKRPLIEADGCLYLGWDSRVQAAVLLKAGRQP